eukprot:scpid50899/ scgid0219/ 
MHTVIGFNYRRWASHWPRYMYPHSTLHLALIVSLCVTLCGCNTALRTQSSPATSVDEFGSKQAAAAAYYVLLVMLFPAVMAEVQHTTKAEELHRLHCQQQDCSRDLTSSGSDGHHHHHLQQGGNTSSQGQQRTSTAPGSMSVYQGSGSSGGDLPSSPPSSSSSVTESCGQLVSPLNQLHRTGSESSVDSGVTAGEATDVLMHSQRLRRMADERLSSSPDKQPKLGRAKVSFAPQFCKTKARSASSSNSSSLGRSASFACTEIERCSEQDGDDYAGPGTKRPESLQLIANANSRQQSGNNGRSSSTTPGIKRQAYSLDYSVTFSAPKDTSTWRGGSNVNGGAPDLSPAATKHRSLRKRKQAIDESLVWIRHQLDTIEWQNQDMICLLLRNIKELRDYKQMASSNNTPAEPRLLHPGRSAAPFYGESRLQRHTGSVYRPRMKAKQYAAKKLS